MASRAAAYEADALGGAAPNPTISRALAPIGQHMTARVPESRPQAQRMAFQVLVVVSLMVAHIQVGRRRNSGYGTSLGIGN